MIDAYVKGEWKEIPEDLFKFPQEKVQEYCD